ncbi:hypothetical protein NQ315_015209 [Exocentrus adspersus]|uniref:Reverse transcriptase domain-containing protein n=1 Tax=Exocentrus adspersus TaxID=1586481 RepID=A0AAV8VW84_9CUCU|nr:hypothetical protein NQ315_015209 [Exocentrus adspersus]
MSEFQQIRTEIENLLKMGAIEECEHCPDQFVSNIFLADKPNGKKRFILNLKQLNAYIRTCHFKMENARTAIRLIQKGTYGATIDLKDAYYLLPIHESSRKFLRFHFSGCLYQFTCLPFGLSSAPFTFTKLLKPVVQKIRSQGIMCVNYLDDFLLLGKSQQDCSRHVQLTISLLESLGFVINRDKSVLIPNTSWKYLGFLFNSLSMTIELPQEKRQKIKEGAQYLVGRTHCSILKFSQFIGLLTSACPAVKYGFLYSKAFERSKFLALKANDENYLATMHISKEIVSDLEWWLKNIHSCYNDLKTDIFDLEIYTDASLSGWGAFSQGASAYGWWTAAEADQHINILELQAIFCGLKCFASDRRDCRILVRTDNTTALANVNKMGSVQYSKLIIENHVAMG